MVRERAGGHEDRPLLAEYARALRFQFLNNAAERIGVWGHRLLIEQAGQQCCVLMRVQADAVAAQPDRPVVCVAGLVGVVEPRAAQRETRTADGQPGCQAAELKEAPPVQGCHDAAHASMPTNPAIAVRMNIISFAVEVIGLF